MLYGSGWELLTYITVHLAISQSHILPKPFLISPCRILIHSMIKRLLWAYLICAKSVLDTEDIVMNTRLRVVLWWRLHFISGK